MNYQICDECHKRKPLTLEYFRCSHDHTWYSTCIECLQEIKRQLKEEQRRNRPYMYKERNRVSVQNSRAKDCNLPGLLTVDEWVETINHFHGCCAVCGQQCYDLFETTTLNLDHWIPINHPDSPGTVVWNAIPLCSECNTLKRNTDPLDWLNRRYSKKKANQIYNEITEYLQTRRGNE